MGRKKHLPFIRLETNPFCASEEYRDFSDIEVHGNSKRESFVSSLAFLILVRGQYYRP